MPETTTIQTSFNNGEISPEIYGRVDLVKYFNSCKTLKNFIALLHGPATRRPGFQYINTAKTLGKQIRLVSFEFSVTQAYILEFGNGYIRFYKDGGIIAPDAWIGTEAYIIGDQVISGVTRYVCKLAHTNHVPPNATYWDPAAGSVSEISSTYIESQLFDLDSAQSADTLYIAHGDHEPATLVRTDHDSWILSDIVFDWPPFLAQNTDDNILVTASAPIGVITVSATQNLFQPGHVGAYWRFLEVVESKYDLWETAKAYVADDIKVWAGNVYIAVANGTSGTRPPVHLSGTESDGVVEWTYLESGVGYVKITAFTSATEVTATVLSRLPFSAADTETITGASQANPCVITAANLYGNGHKLIINDVAGMVELNGNTYTVANATTTTYELEGIDSTGFTAYTSGGTSTKGVHQWAESAWSDVQGWPSIVAFDNERLCWAKTTKRPQSIWMSKVGLYLDHSTSKPLIDSDALSLILGAKKVNAIQWMESARQFSLGTTEREWWLSSATGDGAISSTSKKATPGSFNGSASITPETVGNSIIYVQGQGKIVRELLYNFQDDAFGGNELNLLAKHLTKHTTIKEMAYQKHPNSILWMVRSDGKMIALSYHRAHDVVGWHIHETDGSFESVAVIPGPSEDEVWCSINRTIGGVAYRYVERMSTMFDGQDMSDARFLDSYLTLDGRQDVESISYADPGVITLTGHGYSDGDPIMFRSVDPDPDIEGQKDFRSLNFEEFEVAHKAANTFQLHDPDGNDVDLTEYKTAISSTVAIIVTALSGLDHLEGETVQVLADGAQDEDQVVTGGAITIDGGSVVQVGMGYISDLAAINPEITKRSGQTSQGDIKRLISIILRLNESVGPKVGSNENDLKQLLLVSDQTSMGRSVDLFSGDTEEMSFDGEQRTFTDLLIRQDQPLPLTILAIIAELEI
jgi:hypothetical protein